MKNYLSLCFGLYLLLLPVIGIPATGTSPAPEIDAFIEQQFPCTGSPVMAVAVVDAQGVVYSRIFTDPSIRDAAVRDASSNSLFYVASLSKAVTATAVLLLVQDGLVDLDTPIQHYLPEFTASDPELSAAITVRHLLNQTSGLSDAGYRRSTNPSPSNLDQIAADLASARFAGIPGETYHYFNPNYQLLGLLVEKVQGKSFESFVRQRVLDPLGMTSSWHTDRLDALPGYSVLFGNPVHLFPTHRSWSPSGGLFSTAEDMVRLVQLYLNHGAPLLKPELTQLALTPPGSSPNTVAPGYGMGWHTAKTDDGVHYLTHGGDIPNFHANMALLSDAGYGVVVLYNSNSIIANFSAFPVLLDGLVLILSGRDAPPAGVSMSMIGLVLLIWFLLTLAAGIRKLFITRRWAEKAADWRPLRRLLSLAVNLLPALILLFLPQLMLLLTGRRVGLRALFAYQPDVLLVLTAAGVLGVLHFATRLRALNTVNRLKGRSEPQQSNP